MLGLVGSVPIYNYVKETGKSFSTHCGWCKHPIYGYGAVQITLIAPNIYRASHCGTFHSHYGLSLLIFFFASLFSGNNWCTKYKFYLLVSEQAWLIKSVFFYASLQWLPILNMLVFNVVTHIGRISILNYW